jgi:hypothetical protein
LKVRWTRDAECDRATILDWIAAEDLRAAVRMDACSVPPPPGWPHFRCSAAAGSSPEPAD